MRQSAYLRSCGAAFLATGAALVVHITVGVSLTSALAIAAASVLCAGGLLWVRLSPLNRVRLVSRVRAGLIAGAAATIVYDGTKYVLAFLDPSPYNPFELFRIFGQLLLGSRQTPLGVYAAGMLFHIVNGVAFGVAFCVLVRRAGAWAGVAWAVFLELFQLTLYPGWLDIRFYREFVQISALSHVAYGLTLGTLAATLLHRHRTRSRHRLSMGTSRPTA